MYLLHELIIWRFTFSTYLKKLTSLQNKMIEFIGAAKFCERAAPCYYHLKILKLLNLYKLEIPKFVYANFLKKIPQNFSKFFTLTSMVS